jgi:predicted nucleic acid-binding protein
MTPRVCVDTGPITLYYQKNPPSAIKKLMNQIKNKQVIAVIAESILVESYKHLCKAGGKDYAEGCIRSFLHLIKPRIKSLSSKLIMDAGLLKCQYPSILSYNDAIIIALAIENNATLHTTEKNIPKINHLRLKTYTF